MFVRAFAFSAALLLSGQAFALEPGDLVGVWTTEWSNAANEPITGGGALQIALDTGGESLDGLLPGPGMDGVLNGDVTVGENGALVWTGTWVSYWPEGATRGPFRMVFTDDAFTGTWSTDDGTVQDAAWNGRRAE
jgi:hypothetical protein